MVLPIIGNQIVDPVGKCADEPFRDNMNLGHAEPHEFERHPPMAGAGPTVRGMRARRCALMRVVLPVVGAAATFVLQVRTKLGRGRCRGTSGAVRHRDHAGGRCPKPPRW